MSARWPWAYPSPVAGAAVGGARGAGERVGGLGLPADGLRPVGEHEGGRWSSRPRPGRWPRGRPRARRRGPAKSRPWRSRGAGSRARLAGCGDHPGTPLRPGRATSGSARTCRARRARSRSKAKPKMWTSGRPRFAASCAGGAGRSRPAPQVCLQPRPGVVDVQHGLEGLVGLGPLRGRQSPVDPVFAMSSAALAVRAVPLAGSRSRRLPSPAASNAVKQPARCLGFD